MKGNYIDTPEGRVHYLDEGSGDPVILLHQTPTSADEYADMLPILGKKYWAIALDTLGYGLSVKPKSDNPTIEDYAQNTMHFMDALGIKKASFIGHMTGTAIAGEIAAAAPERVDKLVLLGVSLYTPEEAKMFASNPHFTTPMQPNEDGSFLHELWEICRNGAPNMRTETMYRMLVSDLLSGPRLHDAHLAAFMYDKAPRLKLIQAPTLLMSGDADMFIGKMDAVKELIPRCATKIVSGKTFAYSYDNAEEFCKIAEEFFNNPGV
jgi:pimeloyl-ACP methyl ester carboxylesterase